eukprot:2049220-Rhodomonas_salina.1
MEGLSRELEGRASAMRRELEEARREREQVVPNLPSRHSQAVEQVREIERELQAERDKAAEESE